MNVVLQSRRTQSSRPFPSGPKPLYQIEAECEATDMKTTFHSHAHKTHFHMSLKGFALRLLFKVRVFGTWKWPI